MSCKIAIIEQEEESKNCIVHHLEALQQKKNLSPFHLDTFTNGASFLSRKKFYYDLLLLDINLPDINSLEIAKQFRKLNPSSLIIFTSQHKKYAIDGYAVQAFSFLLKPLQPTILQDTFERALTQIKKRNIDTTRISIVTPQGLHLINASDILYVEVQRHVLFYYILKNNKIITLRTYGSMKDAVLILGDLFFEKCSACYLINLKHIHGIEKKSVLLPQDITLPISRQFFKSFSNALTTYFEENSVRAVN